MTVVIKCWGLANGQVKGSPYGQYLKKYHRNSGMSEWTYDLDEAMKFDSILDARALWLSVHPAQPVRPWDGRPNRPLTAFSVEMGEAEQMGKEGSLATPPSPEPPAG